MGMYTEMILGCSLMKNTPSVCIDALEYVINGDRKEGIPKDVESFIKEYDLIYLMHGGSYYFGVCRSNQNFWYDTIANDWRISVRSNVKNYGGPIQKFLKYIGPYVDRGSGYEHNIYAYVQYEEDEFPTMYAYDGVYKIEDGKLVQKE